MACVDEVSAVEVPFWLDFSGGGFSYEEHIGGMTAPFALSPAKLLVCLFMERRI